MRQERTNRGTDDGTTPAREPTRLGVGVEIPETALTAAQPGIAALPSREKTVLGVGGLPHPLPPPARTGFEESAPIALVARKPESLEPLRTAERPQPVERSDRSEVKKRLTKKSRLAADVPRRGSTVGWVLLVVLVLTGGGASVYEARGRIPWQRLQSWAGSTVARGHALASALANRIHLHR
jgi:hypothetical protein